MLFGMLKDLLKEAVSARHRSQGKPATRGDLAASARRMSDQEAERRRVLELMPNFAEAHNSLGVVLKDTKRLAEAEAAFRRAITLQGDNVTAHYNLGVVLAETNRPWEAEVAYRSAIKLLPEFVEAHNNLGVVLMETKRLVEAEAAFRRALELKPGFVDARKNLELVLTRSGGLAEVERNCRRTLELTPNSAAAHCALGVVLRDSRRLAEAEAAFRRSLQLQEDNVDALYSLGIILGETNRQWEAEAAYRSVLKLRPDFVEAAYHLGLIFMATHRPWEAETAYRRAIELQPSHVEAHNGLGTVLGITSRPAEAEAVFRKVLSLKPDHEAAKKNLDLVSKELKRLSESEARARRAVEQRPESAAHYKLGLALRALGKSDDAVMSFKRALAIEPNHARAHNELGLAFMRRGQLDEAIGCFLKAVSIRPDFAKAMANLGAAYLGKGEFGPAVTWNEAALAIEPQQVDGNVNMALILLGQGKGEEAKRHLDRASAGQSVHIDYATDPKRTVLILWTRKPGNVPTVELIFPQTINTRVNWVMESARDDQSDTLPDYDLAFNAMGEPDLIGDSAEPLNQFTRLCTKPLLNHPDAVARTARNNLPALLDGIDNIVVPAVWRFADSSQWEESMAEQLPLLIRPVDSHGGTGLELATTATELAKCRAAQRGPVYVCRFVDFRTADSWYRKYRTIFVDRKPYPYHLAITQKWMVHYLSAEMESYPWKLEEEKAFLRDPEAVLGSAGVRAIESIARTLDLEYAGIDFSITADKQILVFEANPQMWVHTESIGGPLEHKNEYVFRIQAAFEEMLQRFCRLT